MLNLIRAEVYKLRRQKLFPVLLTAVAAISVFSTYSEIHLLTSHDNPVSGKMSFANAFQDVFMLFLIAVFAGFYIGSDFLNRTIQAELSGGQKRQDIIWSKAIVFSAGAGFIMLLYPVTVCLIHTARFGWGGPAFIPSIVYIARVAILGSILNMGTACIYVCIAFLCRDIPRTICAGIAFPVVFSAVSSTIGKQVPLIGKWLDHSTLSQLKYITGDVLSASAGMLAVLSVCVTVIVSLFIAGFFFSKAEIK